MCVVSVYVHLVTLLSSSTSTLQFERLISHIMVFKTLSMHYPVLVLTSEILCIFTDKISTLKKILNRFQNSKFPDAKI